MKKGFTLIELLVVISIISLLSSIILASLSASRLKAQDANIRSQLRQLATQAELFRANSADDRYGNYFDLNNCPTPPYAPSLFTMGGGVIEQVAALQKIPGANPQCVSVVYPATSGNATSWAVSATLSDGNTFCVDSGGQAGDGMWAAGSQAFPSQAAHCDGLFGEVIL